MKRLVSALQLAVATLALPSVAFSQTTQRTQPYRPAETANGRTVPSSSANLDPVTGLDQSEPYLLRPGHYVYPAPYNATWFSPHMRPFPDYSQAARRAGTRSGSSRFGASRFSRLERGNYSAGPSYYGPCAGGGCAPGYGGYGGYGYGGYDSAAAYDQGRYDADHEYLWFIATTRAGRLLNQYSDQFDKGILKFRDGRYDQALIQLLGAAEKNHASGACRLHAGHALFALGRYQDAMRLITRAFELSPSLTYKDFDIRDEYGDKGDFDRHVAVLRRYVAAHPNDVAGFAVLGYVTFYSEGPGASYHALRRARELAPEDMFIPKLYEIARMTQSAVRMDGPADVNDASPSQTFEGQPMNEPETAPRDVQPMRQPGSRIPGPVRENNPIRKISFRAAHD